jgi:hypothetical protein
MRAAVALEWVEQMRPALAKCFEGEMAGGACVEGQIVAAATVEPSGKVTAVTVRDEAGVLSPEMSECVRRVPSSTSGPLPRPVAATYEVPFSFQSRPACTPKQAHEGCPPPNTRLRIELGPDGTATKAAIEHDGVRPYDDPDLYDQCMRKVTLAARAPRGIPRQTIDLRGERALRCQQE